MSEEDKQEAPPQMLGDSDDDSQQEEKKTQEVLDAELMEAVKTNNVEGVKLAIHEQAICTTEINGWTPLLWAACNGNEEIVRKLISVGAHHPYFGQAEADKEEGEEKDAFKKPPDASKTGKYNPLHWASFKGHVKVVWILLGTTCGMEPSW
jgi:ankyrin repeat protein